MRKRDFFLLLSCFSALFSVVKCRREPREDTSIFSFTSPIYNISLEENARGTQFAVVDGTIRMGVPLLHSEDSIKFKIVEGDKSHLFKAVSKQVGDFVFLRIRQKEKNDQPLNRELKDSYDFVVKATCKRKDSGNLETITRVHLKVTDRNDAFPMFSQEDGYSVTISDKLAPHTKFLQLDASDPDIGIHSEMYYYLAEHSADFTVDPISGWMSTLRSVKAGVYKVVAAVEDRTTRLYYFDSDKIQSNWTTPVTITVTESKKHQTKLLVEKKAISPHVVDYDQLAAVVRLEGSTVPTQLGLLDDDMRHWFRINKTKDHWQLFAVGGRTIPAGTNVTLLAGSLTHGDVNTTATIQIEFKEEHSILFNLTRLEFPVEENVPLGFVVGRLEAFCGNPKDRSAIRYHLESMNQNVTLPFRISATTGILRVSRPLDFEEKTSFEFTVFSKLTGFGEQASVSVVVNVLDSNDHSPTFPAKWSRQSAYPILSNISVGTVLLKVTANDRDTEDDGKISYKLAADVSAPFSIDIQTGEIILSDPLPKGQDEWKVSVWAVDAGQPFSRSNSVNLVFYRNGTKIPSKPKISSISEPLNKNSPIFSNQPSTISINEDSPIGKIVTRVNATDDDPGYAGLVRYTSWNELFQVDYLTGEIRVAADLTKILKTGEEKSRHEMEIIASDLGIPPKSEKKSLSIEILDVNNQSPQFDRPWYRVKTSEDTPKETALLQIVATDDDSGENGRVSYRFTPSNPEELEIHEKTGKITLKKELDRETKDILSYTIVAADQGTPQQMSFVNLTVVVTDVNDNPPMCAQKQTKVRIPEDFPSTTLVGCVSAMDSDLGANGRVRYSLLKSPMEHLPFRIDHHTGCIFLNMPHDSPLDSATRNNYNLTVEVSDNGDTVLSTTCFFVVELIDMTVNLYPPEFEDVAQEASVYENMSPGTEVLRVTAVDPDNKESKIAYSIVGGDGLGSFSVDVSGVIRTAVVLDREEKSKYWLIVEASDRAPQALSSILHVFVKVLDKNDHRPMPVNPIYFASVKENSPQNTVVVKLEASDEDEIDGSTLNYKITKGDPQSFFKIDPTSGYITTSGSRKLDRETQKEHELWVSVCDNGNPQLCSEIVVVVSVEDINDNGPVFSQPIHHFSIPAGVTGQLIRIFAADTDEGLNGQLYYNLTDGDGRFTIDQNGYILVSEPLAGDEVFPIVVAATDMGLPAMLSDTRVVLTGVPRTTRAGPNRPPIIRPTIDGLFHISDADQVGLTVAMAEADDEDGDILWWSISEGNINETFSIRSDNGALLLAKPIVLLEQNLTEITLTIRVTDQELDDKRKITLKLSRSPTSRPQFSAKHYRTQISEKSSIGSNVYSVKAVNSDSTNTRPIVYSVFYVEDTSVEDKLRVEPSTGNVLVMETADFESTREISMVIAARQGALINLATLTVSLTDDNDVPPRFISKEQDVNLPLETPIGSTVTVLQAIDLDSGMNKIVKYSIVSGNEQGMFSLDPSGVLKLAKKLTEDYPEFILTIRATDGGRHPLMDTSILRIRTVMTEDEQMRFSRSVYHYSIKETTPVGSVVAVLSTDPPGRATFSLKDPCPFFSIHPITGVVSLAKWLKRERSKSLECTASATASNGKESSAKLIVKPIQANAHSPIFKKGVYLGVIKENMPAGTPVVTIDNTPLIVSAKDKDSGPNSLIAYRSLNSDDPFFVIDLVSGAIRSRKPLDFEKLKEWSFYVQASDMGQPSRSSVPVLVTVSIQDENDEPPKFEESLYKRSILLPIIPGVKVATVRAQDKDSVGSLKYNLKTKSLSHLFEVDSKSGEILFKATNSSQLNESQYKFEVTVSDGVYLDTTSVELEILNPKKSQFRCAQSEYSISLKENTTFNGRPFLTAVTAVGAREGSTIIYTPLSSDDRFIVNQGTGVVYLSGEAFDREEMAIVRLLIQARTIDHPVQMAHCVVAVTLEDVNDNAPSFVNEPYETIASVTAKTGDKLLVVKAIDHDAGANGMVQYSSNDIPSQFKLNKHDGKIMVAGKLEDKKVYKFTVEATDKGTPSLKSSTQIKVTVVEKARPLFTSNKYETSIQRKTSVGTQILTVKATSNTNGVIVYSIVDGNEDGTFGIDVDTGVLKLKKELKGQPKEISLVVKAKDVTRVEMDSQATVLIKIIGNRDNSPSFEKSIYRANVTETAPIGTVLATVFAEDKDEGDSITYSVSGPDSHVVKIDMDSGVISLAKQVNYEEQQKFEIKVTATDRSQLSEEARLVLQLIDVNDEPPKFVQPFGMADVADTAQPGQFITIMSVTDEDSVSSLPSHGVQYSVIDGDDSLFGVDGQTGEITLVRTIDQEDVLQPEKQLNVSVSDGIFTSYGQLKVSILVTGQRQAAPRFEQSQYVVGVRENIAVENKSALLTVKAKEGVAPLQYSLGGGKDNRVWPVKIEKATGKIYQKRSVSRKNNSNFVIPLIVEDKLGRRAFSTLTLNVLDQNDQEPVFTSKKYSSSISAAAKEGDTVLMISAVDEDEQDTIEYSLVSDSSGLFRLHPRLGVLSLAGKLSVGTTYQLVSEATDMANPPHSATTEIEILVLSAATAIPKFPNNHFMFDVLENSEIGTVVGKLQQIDTAVEAVRYSIVDPDEGLPVFVEKSSGKLIVRGVLDAEEREEWRFLVRADAPAGAHSITTVTIRVINVDDNPPVFHGSYSLQEIPEDAPIGSSITVFSVTDPDGPQAGGVTFSLLESKGVDKVRIDPESGWLLVAKELDREKESFYDLTVRASDEAGNKADMPFRLEITDVNDEEPKFDETSYNVMIHPENLKVGQPVLKMEVKDRDLAPFNLTRLFIKRGNEDGLFAIDDSGTLSISRLRFSPNILFYNLTVLAFDGKHATTADVKVNVNHTTPEECPMEDLKLEIEENSQMKSLLWRSKNKDQIHQLVSSEDLPFVISKDGRLIVNGELDAEKRSFYSFQILGNSNSKECLRRVTVQIKDINDNLPIFSKKEYSATIKENQPATFEERQFVLRVHAEDKDSGLFGQVKYSLADGHGAFEIDESSGVITLTKPLDREEKEHYTLHVLASDSDPSKPKSSKSSVKIQVADQNDNPPAFERKEYLVQVMESETVGYKLLTVKALGGDEGETVSYTLEDGSGKKYFKLDSKSGDLFLNESLDFEKEKSISATIVATDSGSPPLSSKTTLTIQVLDENDNSPVFSKNSYRAEVKENSPNGTIVIKIEASDADSEHYGRVEFSLSDGSLPFNITKDGDIVVAGSLNYEEITSYRATVTARDGGNLTSQVTVLIEILDENDNPPHFEVCNMTAVVQEGVTPGHIVMTMSIRDPDGPKNAGPFSVKLKGEGHRSFLVDETLNIVTAARLDHSKKDKFLLTVLAEDKGGLTADCPLTIYVKEESRHPPKITPLKVSLNLLKGEFRGGIIGKVVAKDEDIADMLRYSLVEGSVIGPLVTSRTIQPSGRGPHSFRIDSENGDLWAENSISDGLHAMNVSVTDGKYNTVSFVEVEVVSLQQDSLEHAVSIRILGMTPEQFLSKDIISFRKIFSKYLNVRPENINLLSIQDSTEKNTRVIRSASSSVDVLFSVSRGIDGVDRGLLKPDHIYSRLKQDLFAIAHESSMKYQLTTEVCTAGQCVRGECRERIELSDHDMTILSVDGTGFVAPMHSRFAECSCPEGFAGSRCEVVANACSRTPCASHEMCAPDEDSPVGFECICPPGTTGEMCREPACRNEGRCLEEAELSVSGNGFFELLVSNDVEMRMDLDIEMRLVSSEGIIFSGKGQHDFHLLEVHSGRLEYRWDAGSGPGTVKSKLMVSDGKWHRVRISRRGRRTRLSVDEKETEEAWSPPGADVLNLQSAGVVLTFGAKVIRSNSSFEIKDGVIACFKSIALDGRSLAKTRQGLRLQNAAPSCKAMASTPCSDVPCKNGATCHAIGKTYSCLCPSRYEGAHCEIDRDPCGSSPCPPGIQCIPFYNEYMCKCPNGFTGKHCGDRGFNQADENNACAANPCGSSGECISIPRQSMTNAGYICNCTHGLTSSRCDEGSNTSVFSKIQTSELLFLGVIFVLILIFSLVLVLLCYCMKKMKRDPKYGEHVSVPHMVNPHVAPNPSLVPPPLPPRGFRGNKLSNLEQAQLTGLPTVTVRPMERFARGDSRSPSLVGSGKHQWKKGSHDYGSAATDMDNMGHNTYDSKQLEALRRIGIRLEDDSSSSGSGPSRVSRVDRRDRRAKESLEKLNQDRYPLGDSIQCLPTTADEPTSQWGDDIGEAVRKERFRLEALTGRVHVGESILSPLINDEDYMTMKPRSKTDSADSQRRPLLSAAERIGSDSPKGVPPPPAHRNLFDDSRVYDETYETKKAAPICDIDDSEAEEEL